MVHLEPDGKYRPCCASRSKRDHSEIVETSNPLEAPPCEIEVGGLSTMVTAEVAAVLFKSELRSIRRCAPRREHARSWMSFACR